MVADALGMKRVMLHPLAGVLSAYGIGLAELKTVRERTMNIGLARSAAALVEAAQALASEGVAALAHQGAKTSDIRTYARVELRYEGVESTLAVPLRSETEMLAAFEDQHRRRFGFISGDKG